MTTSRTQDFWEDHYGKSDRVWSGRANPVLVSTVEAMTPGTALDLGCGEGGDAIWLASHGWQVTAADVSPTAISRAQAAAQAAGVGDRISWEEHDFTVSLPDGSFDLVSAQFLQAPVDFPLESVLSAAATKVAPGGLLLVVSHAAGPSWAQSRHEGHEGHGDNRHHHGGHGDHGHEVRFPTPQETLESLQLSPGDWRIDRVEVAERDITAPDGSPATLLDSVVAVTRMT